MKGEERRAFLLRSLQEAHGSLTGSDLASMSGVSRQVIVQDIALLRGQGVDITATRSGYALPSSFDGGEVRLVKVRHAPEQAEEEMLAVVDLGGALLDVAVNHRAYGKLTATLDVRSRRDVARFMEDIRSGKSSPLCAVTSGYHFHHIAAYGPDASCVLDEIEKVLGEKRFLAEMLPYEVGQI